MPILLNEISNIEPVASYSPKFFDSKLTGAGKKVGLLNELRNPGVAPPVPNVTSENVFPHKKTFTSGKVTTSIVPVSPLDAEAWKHMDSVAQPDLGKLTRIGVNNDWELYVDMPVHSLVIEEHVSAQGSTSRKCTACYQLMFYSVYKKSTDEHIQVKLPSFHYSVPQTLMRPENTYAYMFTCAPMEAITDTTDILASGGYVINPQDILDFVNDYSLYDAVCDRSEQWQTTIDTDIRGFLENVSKHYMGANNMISQSVKPDVICALRRIEDYKIPLELYKNIYNTIRSLFSKDEATALCKQNLNLLLSDTMNSLDASKAMLTKPPVPTAAVNPPASLSRLSPEQHAAVTSPDPLVLVQSGAGSGKSTVILARIDWLIAAGVNPADITVLSFTNAAADHISEKNPTIHSMTIARMIHEIYTKNFPNHELSSLDTIINSLDIYFPKDAMANQFKRLCLAITKNDSDAFTLMNAFVENNYVTVMKFLDTIRQTSLELEIIICYQRIDMLVEPPEVQSKYLIIDEVQDNSIFEFIYTLKYIDKHKESLFIVGDCSQTLFEFRASNPRALNVLESSGVFTTYQLQVNYRSNQEILDFANVVLRNIEANKYANIQLRANSLSPVTGQSFADKVKLYYHQVLRIKDLDDAISTIFTNVAREYIQECLDKKEQVAFMAFTRQHVKLMEDVLRKMFPNAKVASLVPDRMKNTTVFSEFIKKYWSEIKFSPTHGIDAIIANELMAKLPYLVYNVAKVQPVAQKQLANWRTEQGAHIKMWQNQYVNGQITHDQLLENVRESMLSYEIKSNAARQALLSAQNEVRKNNEDNKNADIVLSTIHSAKGLEFPHVVLLYRNENDMPEDKKRMHYVALTRAMKSEFIVAYDTVKSPQIQADYNQICEMLSGKVAAGTAMDNETEE